MKNLRFSLFRDEQKGIFNTHPLKEIGLENLFDIYQNRTLGSLTSQLINAPEDKKQEAKKRLPFITPNGTFAVRKSERLIHHNSNLVALDIDGLNLQEVKEVKQILSNNSSTLLCCVSPRRNGVKALILISEHLTPENRYNTLKFNKKLLAEGLGIAPYIDKIDNAQFVLPQPFFLATDENLYTNIEAIELSIKFEHPEEIITEIKPFQHTPPKAQSRIEAYILNAARILSETLAAQPEGNRHFSISRVKSIAGLIHYAPNIESDVKASLMNGIIHSYGSEKEAIKCGAVRSFNEAWSKAIDLHNETIEAIINEVKQAI